ncbi:MAG: ribosome biogenesis factor YjgA [Gammaproteobacteria bacterium]|jgi:ribosome-associated protein
MKHNDDKDIEYVSKSQMKREMLALQELGEKLVALSTEQIHQLQLPDILEKAVLEARQIKKHGAMRRQLQYIGRLMRDVDADNIQLQYDNVTQHSAKAVQQLHKIEKWRERLLEDGDDAIQALVEEFPGIDRQQLRQLIRTANQEKLQNKPPKAYRKIFQLLKSEYE